MKPSEISLFSPKEQTLLVATEPTRLEKLDEDELSDLLGRVRRGRNKYSDLHRRQGAKAVRTSGKRYAAETSNERTLRKAEIFEDAISRVARYLSRAARANANELKRERIETARSVQGATATRSPATKTSTKKPDGSTQAKRSTDIVDPARTGSTSARNKRNQGSKDARR